MSAKEGGAIAIGMILEREREVRPSELGRSTLSKQISSPEAAFSLLARARGNYAKQHARKEDKTWAGHDETCGGNLKVNLEFSQDGSLMFLTC